MTLDEYLKREDDHEAREEAISDLSVEIGQIIKSGHMYHVAPVFNKDKPYWTMDDFISDVEIVTKWMSDLIDGNAIPLQEDMAEKFDKFCEEIAEQCIDEIARQEYQYHLDEQANEVN